MNRIFLLLILASVGGGIWHYMKPAESPEMVEHASDSNNNVPEHTFKPSPSPYNNYNMMSQDEIIRMRDAAVEKHFEAQEQLLKREQARRAGIEEGNEKHRQRMKKMQQQAREREGRNITMYITSSSGIIDTCYKWYKNDQKKMSDCIKRQSSYRNK